LYTASNSYRQKIEQVFHEFPKEQHRIHFVQSHRIMLRIAVVTPFLDKRHGTERCVAEQVERLARDYGYEIHIYSQRVEDIPVTTDGRPQTAAHDELRSRSSAVGGRIIWHKIPDIPGPQLLKFPWWFVANQLWRWWDRKFRRLRYDLVYTPGINCLDADVSVVHIVFHEFYRQVKDELSLRDNPVRAWPRLIHRWIYYHLIMALEKQIYPNLRLTLGAVSGLTAKELQRFFGRNDVHVIPNAVDVSVFNPYNRHKYRDEARRRFNINDKEFVLLLIGNDWKKKGLPCILEAMYKLRDLPLRLLVVGRDDQAPYEISIQQLGPKSCVSFLEPSPDVIKFYAAADVYVGPSLHDSFAFPPVEAMACGLPVITSINNGGSEIITDGVDGFILKVPTNSDELAQKIRLLYEDVDLRCCLGENASKTARQYTWEQNVRQMETLFRSLMMQG
jgi:UDP-glucose:(heptosyl)LPS alpha-1,3-glucosyltransferase